MQKETYMKKIVFFLFLGLVTENSFAETRFSVERDSLSVPESAQTANVDFYFNGSFAANKSNSAVGSAGFRVEDARINIQGNYNEDLSYRVRFRLNRPYAPTSQDNASVALDFAYLTYKFGKDRKWDLRLGKAYAMVGSYEQDINPLYEYAYGDYLAYIVNPFTTVFQVGYALNDRHKVGVQAHNTKNTKFAEHLESNGLTTEGFVASKVPIGGYLYWNGSFFDGVFQTNYSYDVAQFAKDYFTHTVSLGHQLKVGKHWAYLDLVYSHMGADYATVASKLLNTYQARPKNVMYKNIVYKGIISRYEYQVNDYLTASAKLAVEFAGSQNLLSENFRQNYTYFLALQYKPFKTQDFSFYGVYSGNTINYSKELNKNSDQSHRVAIGAYYTLPVLRKK